MQQLSEVSARLAKQSPPTHLHTILIGRSKTMLYNEDYKPLPLSNWQQDLASSKQPALADNKLVEYLNSAPHKTILVDNTSSENVAKLYPTLLASSNGISVVTPNKKAFSSGLELYQNIQRSAANSSGQSIILHESTVGAGLPIISTLRDLVDTGDTVEKIEGVFSGTMSFLFNSFMPLGGGGGSFSAEVIKAKDLGYTEPDPRDDLNGLDVARKLTILARVIGLSVSGPTSFPVQSLVPKELEDCSADDFVSKLAQFDDRMAKLKQDAAAKNKVVRYVGSIDVAKNDIKVGVETCVFPVLVILS